MKRLLMGIILVAIVSLGLNTATASAGYCYTQSDVGNSQLHPSGAGPAFRAKIFGCVQVRRMQWGQVIGNHTAPDATGWIWDSSNNTVHDTGYYGAMTQTVVGPGTFSVVYYQNCWWSGGWTFSRWLSNNFKFRVESATLAPNGTTIYSWGDWHPGTASSGYQFTC